MRCVDLFAGCGGLSLGLENAGIEVVAAVENWTPSIEVYRENFSHPVLEQDLSAVKESIEVIRPFEPEIIAGGPPCQDFSSAGPRNHNGKRADLTYCFADIVCGVKPEWFIMENVELIKKSHVLREVVEQFIKSGYGLSAAILDASFCGVPQARTRFFMIGHQGDSHNTLIPILKNNLSDEPMHMRHYFGEELNLEYYYRHPRNYNRRAVFTLDEPSPTVRGVNRPVPKGYKLNSCDPDGVDIGNVRPLTTIERSYVQTFPKSFKFKGSKTNLEQMIGNAVPVKLGEYIGRSILGYLEADSGNFTSEFIFHDRFEIPQRKLMPEKKHNEKS